MSSNYSELLKNPLWQRKRLEILGRDNFVCQSCGVTNRTLHVHHCYYERGKMPWEYPPEALITLCEICHEEERNGNEEQKDILLDLLDRKGFVVQDIKNLINSIKKDDINKSNIGTPHGQV